MNTPREPGIDQLISALTADGRPDELAGRDAALAAFRAAGQRAATEPTLRQRRVDPFRRPLAGWLPTRLAAPFKIGRAPWLPPRGARGHRGARLRGGPARFR